MIRIPVEAQMTEYLHRKAAVMRTPLTGSFELTPLCNMNCRMCYVRLSKEQQEAIGPLHTAEEWIQVAEKAKEAGMLYLLLTGGEPFLHPQFRTILESLHRMGFIISVNTNGTMINEETVAWLKDSPPVRFNITLYGASDETYGRLCRNPKGFTQVSHAITLLKEAGFSIRINCSVTPYNKDDLKDIIKFCNDNRLIIAPTAYMFPPLRKNASMIGTNDRFTAVEAAKMQAEIEHLLVGDEEFVKRVDSKEIPVISTVEEDCQNVEGDRVRCRAGKCTFWVTWYGRMIPCGMIPVKEPYLNVFRDDFKACWDVVTKETDKIRLPKQCAVCKLKNTCRACAAMVYTETGQYDRVPVYRCEMAHAYPAACKETANRIRLKDTTNEI